MDNNEIESDMYAILITTDNAASDNRLHCKRISNIRKNDDSQKKQNHKRNKNERKP